METLPCSGCVPHSLSANDIRDSIGQKEGENVLAPSCEVIIERRAFCVSLHMCHHFHFERACACVEADAVSPTRGDTVPNTDPVARRLFVSLHYSRTIPIL